MQSESRWIGSLRFTLAFCMFLFPAIPGAAQIVPAGDDATQLHTVLAELRSLRVELLEFKIDQVHSRIAEIDKLLRNTETERDQLSTQQRSQIQELGEIDERLTQPSLAMEARSELQAYRTELATRGAARLAERASSIASREAELRLQLHQQERLRQQLVASHHALARTLAPTN